MSQEMRLAIFLTGFLILTYVSGCSALDIMAMQDDDAKALAICITAEPEIRGQPVGPIGVITAKAAKDFVGKVTIGPDCSITIESK